MRDFRFSKNPTREKTRALVVSTRNFSLWETQRASSRISRVRPGQRQVRGRVELNIVGLFQVKFSLVEASSSLKIGDFMRESSGDWV